MALQLTTRTKLVVFVLVAWIAGAFIVDDNVAKLQRCSHAHSHRLSHTSYLGYETTADTIRFCGVFEKRCDCPGAKEHVRGTASIPKADVINRPGFNQVKLDLTPTKARCTTPKHARSVSNGVHARYHSARGTDDEPLVVLWKMTFNKHSAEEYVMTDIGVVAPSNGDGAVELDFEDPPSSHPIDWSLWVWAWLTDFALAPFYLLAVVLFPFMVLTGKLRM